MPLTVCHVFALAGRFDIESLDGEADAESWRKTVSPLETFIERSAVESTTTCAEPARHTQQRKVKKEKSPGRGKPRIYNSLTNKGRDVVGLADKVVYTK